MKLAELVAELDAYFRQRPDREDPRAGQSRLNVDGLADALRSYLGSEIKVQVLTRPRACACSASVQTRPV